MGDCPSPSSRSRWMEGECQSLMFLMAWRDIDRWMDGWMHGCMHGWMDGSIDACMHACMDRT